MSDALERAEMLLNRAQQTSKPEWASAHALVAVGILLKECMSGRS